MGASLVAQSVKNLPAVRHTQVGSLGQGRSPGEGNGNPLQYPCLENPKDRGAWWAAVHGVTESGTTEQLTRLLLLLRIHALQISVGFFQISKEIHLLKKLIIIQR